MAKWGPPEARSRQTVRMAAPQRLLTLTDIDDRDARGTSIFAHLYVVLTDGIRVLLLDDRGWSSSQPIDDMTRAYVTSTAKMAVGPDGPGPGETDAQMETWHWESLARRLEDSRLSITGIDLSELPHDVEISESLSKRLKA
jgi:hypothetical protein